MKVELDIKKDSFENERREKVEYYSCKATVCGEEIRFTPRKDDRKLFEHLMKSCEVETA